MSGPRQHHIPQALQKGFAAPAGKRFNVWLYRKGNDGPVNTNIKNVGLTVDFYVVDGDDSIDRDLTRLENEYGAVLAKIRQGQVAAPSDLFVLKRLMANCMVRTERVRLLLAEAQRGAAEFFRKLGSDSDSLRKGMRAAYEDEEYLMELLRKSIREIGKPVPTDAVLRPLLRSQVAKAKGDFDRDMPKFAAMSKGAFEIAAQSASKDPQAAHLNAIRKAGVEPAARLQQIESKPFSVVSISDTELVLGDCVLIGIDREGTFIDALCPRDEIQGLLMPVTPHVFAFSGAPEHVPIGGHDINDASIGLSYQFFIAKARSDSLANRISDIGSRPNIAQQIPWDDLHGEFKQLADDGMLHKGAARDV